MINHVIYIDDGEKIPSEEIFRYLDETQGLSTDDDILKVLSCTLVGGGHVGCEADCETTNNYDEYHVYMTNINGAFYDSENQKLYMEYVKGVTDMEITDGSIFYCETCESFGGWIYTEEIDEEDYE